LTGRLLDVQDRASAARLRFAIPPAIPPAAWPALYGR